MGVNGGTANYLILDGEWTVGQWGKGAGGDPFDPRNRLCLVGALAVDSDGSSYEKLYKIEYDSEPFGHQLSDLQKEIEHAELLVLFNAKRDLHWLRRYGIKFQHKRVWDVQLAHFVMGGQEEPYPSLEGVCQFHGIAGKANNLWEEFYSKKIDTDQIPLSTLLPYLTQDLIATKNCYEAQEALLKDTPAMRRLINLQNIDLLILEEMEWNGIILDVEACRQKAVEIRSQLSEMDASLTSLVDGAAINWNSGDQLSIVLYGGKLTYPIKEPDGVYKTGKKAGQAKFKTVLKELGFPRLVVPLEGSGLAKDGYWSTAEATLRSLKATGRGKEIIGILLQRTKLEKLVSGYYEGLPKQIATLGWEGNRVHGTLNQCVAATGRLSSSKPNLQNQPPQINTLFRSRYGG